MTTTHSTSQHNDVQRRRSFPAYSRHWSDDQTEIPTPSRDFDVKARRVRNNSLMKIQAVKAFDAGQSKQVQHEHRKQAKWVRESIANVRAKEEGKLREQGRKQQSLDL